MASDVELPSKGLAFWRAAWRKAEAERKSKFVSRLFGVLIPLLALAFVASTSNKPEYLQKFWEAVPISVATAAIYWIVYSVKGLWTTPRLMLLDAVSRAEAESDRKLADAIEEARRVNSGELNASRDEVRSLQDEMKRLMQEREVLKKEIRAIRQPTLDDLASETKLRIAKINTQQVTAFQVLEWIHFESPRQRKGYYRGLAHRTLFVPPSDQRVINERLSILFDFLKDRGLVAWQVDASYPDNEYIWATPIGSDLVRLVRNEHQ